MYVTVPWDLSNIQAFDATCGTVVKKNELVLRYWCHYRFTPPLDYRDFSLQQLGPLPHSRSTFHFQEDLCGLSISVLPSP